jgi:hypothetical protein
MRNLIVAVAASLLTAPALAATPAPKGVTTATCRQVQSVRLEFEMGKRMHESVKARDAAMDRYYVVLEGKLKKELRSLQRRDRFYDNLYWVTHWGAERPKSIEDLRIALIENMLRFISSSRDNSRLYSLMSEKSLVMQGRWLHEAAKACMRRS